MIIRREPEEVTSWFIAFHPAGRVWWTRLIPGRFKHVSAFAYAPRARAWVYFDKSLAHTTHILLPDGQESLETVSEFIPNCSVLHMQALPPAGRTRIRIHTCTAAVRDILGMPGGALSPDALWRDMLANGAKVIHHGVRLEPQAECARDSGPAAASTG